MKAIMTILILLAGGFAALAFILSPAGKTTVSFITAKLQPAPLTVASAEMPKLSEEDLTPPMTGETVPVESKSTPAPAPAAPAETGPDDTFERVMAVYEQDSKEQSGDGI